MPFIQILFGLLCFVVFLIWYHTKIRVRPSVQRDPNPKFYMVLVHSDITEAGYDEEKKYHWDLIMSVLGSEDNIKAATFISLLEHRVHGFMVYLTEEQAEAISSYMMIIPCMVGWRHGAIGKHH